MTERLATASAAIIARDVAELIRPPRRVRVSQSAAENMYVVDGGGRAVLWQPDTTPYMIEPMDCLNSRLYDAVVFIGPSRSGKTMALVDGWLAYIIDCDPGDALIVQISEEKAREYSKKRVDRMLRNSPALAKRVSPRGHDNNVHDRTFRAGNYLGIKWPSVNVLSSSDYRFVALTDYDRLDEDIDGEGDAYSLASKRTQTFLSSGMTLIETSPGWEIEDPDWRQPADAPHMAPPTKGGLGLYNRGDRRRLYWQCNDCREWYQPTIANWHQPSARPVCPYCGCQPRPEDKRKLNLAARWVPEGCRLSQDGKPVGTPRRSRIASFWMEGPAAAYQPWSSLAEKLAAAEEAFEATGTQEKLKSVLNTDWGRPYLHRRSANQRSSERLMDRAETESQREVPDGARFLTASVDVQGGRHRRFVVQVQGWGVGREGWIVDRFNIREDRDADPPRQVDPATRPEDWDVLTRDILPRSYLLSDGSGRRMHIAMVTADIGGEAGNKPGEGVTAQAYDWYRRLRRNGLHRRVMLVKGAPTKTANWIHKSYPDNTGRKDRRSGAKGDVPIYLLSTDDLKDTVAAMLDRPEPGAGYLHTPDWLGRWFYDELTYEERGVDGKWRKPGNRANEAFDLCAYNLAAYMHKCGARFNWQHPPPWAQPWDSNTLVVMHEHHSQVKAPAQAGVARSRRRASRSSYLTR